ncbi:MULTISPECIES: TolC family protein [Stenotrophomonas]|uniref:TolC family protein n=1 Tax=Stenotrophomonas tumulicola TaxID=1685415 RepID=A0A7W3IGQ8_9GAMM|nr:MULTISPECIES: TolC family protein [Stenotrophomonas]MBA8681022.1 TolC family protein [Stenotrophomonas tumulicola]
MSFSSPLHHRCSICRLRVWVLAFGLFAVAPAWSATASITFDDAVRLAAERAPMLQARQSQIAASQEEAVRAAALPDPRLTLGVANLPVTGADAFDASADFMTMKQIGVMQDFPAHAKRQARQAVADRTVEQAQALSVAERLAVRQAVARAWIAQWAAQREVTALQALREPTGIAVRSAKARLAGGTGSAVDAMATQNAALEVENRIDDAEASLEAARASLARWLGEEPMALRIEGAPPELMTLPVAPATLVASVDRQGPLLPWHSRETIAEAQVDAAIAEKRPDWSLGVTYGQRERTPEGLPRSDMLMVEFAIDLPLFPRNRQDRGVAARRAELDTVAAEREDARRAQAERVRMTLAEWEGLKRQVARKETESLPLARDRAKTALAAYAAGADLQPWLEARRDEIELHVMHARHLGELGRAWAALAYLLPEEERSP